MNPAVGLLPIAIFILLNGYFVDIKIAIGAAALLSMLFDACFRFVLKTNVFALMSVISVVPLLFTCFFTLFAPSRTINPHNYMIICEIWMVLSFYVILRGKKFVGNFYKKIDIREKNLLHEIFSTITIAEHLFTLHLFVVLAYSFISQSYGFNGIDFAIYVAFPVLIILAIICYESFMLRSFSTRFFKEEWLPIVNEQGKVIGKVAKSVSFKMKNRFLHPVIRIALVCNGAIYLQKRPEDSPFEQGYLDHPFEKYMLFKHDLNLSARNSIARQLGGELIPFSFLLKYIYENSETKRLVLFYVAQVESVAEIKNVSMMTGKFWTMKQIEEDIPSNIFGECFLREYEYMKNTILNPVIKETTENSYSYSRK